VEDPDTAVQRYRLCAQARGAFADLDDDATAQPLATAAGIGLQRLRELAAQCGNAEAFTMRIASEPDHPEQLALEQAERRLSALETTHKCACP
jgi:hypothetical protein